MSEPKIVLDTNTFVSAFFWDGNEAALLRKIEQGAATLHITQDILYEIEDVVKRPKFQEVMTNAGLTPAEIMQRIISLSHLVIGSPLHITACRDADDNKFLECAVHAKADYIVSGDQDLLSLKRYENIPIVRTKKMLELVTAPS
ncbi:MAG: putative toxin-antitoxin system toxin component, PIN family [Candidatus Woesearchaeota archaeon]|nr:putative toxin-antitoxin system toxin component, PIN family [Candidatus Woesearchaeota archaeon]